MKQQTDTLPTPRLIIKGYRVLVMMDKVSEDIVIEGASQFSKNTGVIVAVGDGRYNHAGDIARFDVCVGERVFLTSFAVTDYEEDGILYKLASAEDVFGVIPPAATPADYQVIQDQIQP